MTRVVRYFGLPLLTAIAASASCAVLTDRFEVVCKQLGTTCREQAGTEHAAGRLRKCDCSRWRGSYFATQTLTTVGYGSEIYLEHGRIRWLATWGSILAAVVFATLTAALFWSVEKGWTALMQRFDPKRNTPPGHD